MTSGMDGDRVREGKIKASPLLYGSKRQTAFGL
jgi:hypothetical protein